MYNQRPTEKEEAEFIFHKNTTYVYMSSSSSSSSSFCSLSSMVSTSKYPRACEPDVYKADRLSSTQNRYKTTQSTFRTSLKSADVMNCLIEYREVKIAAECNELHSLI